MFKVRSPLSPEVAVWAVGRGFGLWDWAIMPVIADAAEEDLGTEARAQLLDHGRWLVLAQIQALCRPLWTYPGGAWDFKPWGSWSAGKLGEDIRSFCGPRKPLNAATFDEKARAILEAIRSRPKRAKDLFRGVRGETHMELILLRSLLEQFLACEAYRPGKPASE